MDVKGRGYASQWRGMSENLKTWPDIYIKANHHYKSSSQMINVLLINQQSYQLTFMSVLDGAHEYYNDNND